MGEKYDEQGGRLTGVLRSALIEKGFCSSPQDCQRLLPGTAAHGDRVRVSYYEINEKNTSALLFLIDMVIRDGLAITDGVPITVTAYRESHEKYRKSGVFLKDVTPFFVLEVNK